MNKKTTVEQELLKSLAVYADKEQNYKKEIGFLKSDLKYTQRRYDYLLCTINQAKIVLEDLGEK